MSDSTSGVVGDLGKAPLVGVPKVRKSRCPRCKAFFDYGAVPESRMGSVRCPECGAEVTQGQVTEGIRKLRFTLAKQELKEAVTYSETVRVSLIVEQLRREGRILPVRAFAAFKSRVRTDERLQKALLENQTPACGPFYVIRDPARWDLFVMREDDFGEMDHGEVWEDYLSPILEKRWKKPAGSLKPYTYAFPRGRVVEGRQQGSIQTYKVLSCMDWARFVSKSALEQAFGVEGRVIYESDDHECCQVYDRDAVRQLLKIKETWPAVE